jgi:hypothetical protein
LAGEIEVADCQRFKALIGTTASGEIISEVTIGTSRQFPVAPF